MEGKSKKKRKVGKIILFGMSFLLTIVLTFSLTLAWFFDADWASNYVTMAGSVGIEIQEQYIDTADGNKVKFRKSSGKEQLHFDISTNLAYPGQAIEINASVYNNGGLSANDDPVANPNKGSACYVRARFEVYTDIGNSTDPEVAASEASMNAENLYKFLQELVIAQNNVSNSGYCWRYLRTSGAKAITASGTAGGTLNHYLEGLIGNDANSNGTIEDGEKYTASSTVQDKGYYYLCYKNGTELTTIMKPLSVDNTSVFLWNNTFVIPWTLTNYSADKHIFVAVIFQAIQTFIPSINASTGVISTAANNQEGSMGPSFVAAEDQHYTVNYDNTSLQTVFNSCYFGDIDTTLTIGGVTVDFKNSKFGNAVRPDTDTPANL